MQKIIALSFLCVFSLVSNTWAWVGGPFSNNSPQGDGNAGTYQGVMQGTNLTGSALFGISKDNASIGQYIVFQNGVVTTGPMQGNLDNISKKIVAIFYTVAVPVTTANPRGINGFPGFFNGKLTRTAPAVQFSGRGRFTVPAGNATTNVNFRITGTRTSQTAVFGTPAASAAAGT